MKTILTSIASLFLAINCPAISDTSENRVIQAKLYFNIVTPSSIIAERIRDVSSVQDTDFINSVISRMNMKSIYEILTDNLAARFTPDELKSLQDFAASSEGNSAMAKFGVYLVNSEPMILGQLQSALRLERIKTEQGAAANP